MVTDRDPKRSDGADQDELSDAERAFIDQYSGTNPNPDALTAAREETAHLQATTKMPDIPHIDQIRAALPTSSPANEAILVTAFLDRAIIDNPDTDESLTVRQWLKEDRGLDRVLDLARSLRYDP